MTFSDENVLVINPFRSEYPDELDLNKGEIVQLVAAINEDWYFVIICNTVDFRVKANVCFAMEYSLGRAFSK
jgi:hypothetical protein